MEVTEAAAEAPAAAKPSLGLVPFALGAYACSRLVALVGFAVAAADTDRPVWELLTNWDGSWYALLVDQGYPHEVPVVLDEPTGAGQTTLGTFPLFALAARLVKLVSPLDTDPAMVLVAVASGAVASVLFAVLMKRLGGERFARRATTLFVFLPTSLAFSMAYAEALAVTLFLACFLALERRAWIWAGVFAALAGATRPHGFVIVVPCVVVAVMAIRERREWRALLAPALAPFGTIATLAFLWHHTGVPRAWFEGTAAGWGESRLTLESFGIVGRFLADPFDDQVAVVMTIGTVTLVVLAYLLVRWRPPAPYLLFTLAYLAVLLTNDRGVRGRYLLLAFPLFGALAFRIRSRPSFVVAVGLAATALFAAAIYHSLPGPTAL